MLITKKVKIKINSGFHIKYFKDNNIIVKKGDEIEIDILLLPKGSHQKVKANCDYCGYERELYYKEYNYSVKSNNKFCCSECIKLKISETCLKKYGVDNYSKTDEYKKKIKKTCIEKYGVDSYSKTDNFKIKIKETSIEKYGVDHYSKTDEYKEKLIEISSNRTTDEKKIITEKMKATLFERTGYEHALQNPKSSDKYKKTILKKYGVDSYSKTDEYKENMNYLLLNRTLEDKNKIKDKIKKTCLFKFGVNSPLQNIEIFEKQQTSAYKCKKYKDIFYRGTYELDFIENFYDKILIEKAESINYFFDNKNRKYHPDFYLPEYNLIVEIKSTYTYNYNIDMNESKKEYVLKNGYDFIFIIDKNYTEFINKINLH